MQPQLLDAADQALARGDGVTAERLLRSLIDLCGDQVLLRAKLGRSLLLQEAFIEAEAVLLPLTQQPTVSFWTYQKLGDALWGQRKLRQAAEWYEQALAQGGSGNAATVANHLKLLDLIDPRLAIAWLNQWSHEQPDTTSAWVQGANEACQTSAGPSLKIWLECRGLATDIQPSADQSLAPGPLRISPDYRRHWQQTSRGCGVVGYLAEQQQGFNVVVDLPLACGLAVNLAAGLLLIGASAMPSGLQIEVEHLEEEGALLLIPAGGGATKAESWSLTLWLAPEAGAKPAEPSLWLRAIPLPAHGKPHEAAWLNGNDSGACPSPGGLGPFWEQELDAQLWSLVADPSHQALIDLHTATQQGHHGSSALAQIRLALLIQQRAAQLRGSMGLPIKRPGPPARFVLYWDRAHRLPAPLQNAITELLSVFPASVLLSDASLEPERLDFGNRPLVWQAFESAPHPALRSDLLRLGLHYQDHGWLDPDVHCSPWFAPLADDLVSQCCAQGISLVPLLKQPDTLWGSPASCLGAYPINGMLVLAPGFRERLLDQLELDLATPAGDRLIDGISGPGLLNRCLWSAAAGHYRLAGFLQTESEPLPLWRNTLGERFVMPGFDSIGLTSLAPEDKYRTPDQNWRNLASGDLAVFLAGLTERPTTP